MPSASSAGDRAGLSSSFWVINIHILPFEAADSMDPLTGLGRVGVSEAENMAVGGLGLGPSTFCPPPVGILSLSNSVRPS